MTPPTKTGEHRPFACCLLFNSKASTARHLPMHTSLKTYIKYPAANLGSICCPKPFVGAHPLCFAWYSLCTQANRVALECFLRAILWVEVPNVYVHPLPWNVSARAPVVGYHRHAIFVFVYATLIQCTQRDELQRRSLTYNT